ncbi:hypothetical protein [Marinimicrobium sp. ABcell2]|uniref:hypothetical protein n=1 Tax=Marinimicrobium sp. ABcell2 TaxID=3069751 RepID=UPI0027B49AD0|nr:hypothetical protein [Marinimicrobium sp. ABcell2]MDQ2076384.1 hypothetical protein [Marinimicrobium sp. ABcell2]
MKNILATIILLAISSSVFAYECGDRAFTSTRTQDGSSIGLFASAEDFEGAEKWDINSGEPPLSVSQAVSIVTEWAEGFYHRFDSMAVKSVRIQEYGCWDARGHWLYVFSLSPVIDDNRLHGSGYMAAVTMSGKVIEPREFGE